MDIYIYMITYFEGICPENIVCLFGVSGHIVMTPENAYCGTKI